MRRPCEAMWNAEACGRLRRRRRSACPGPLRRLRRVRPQGHATKGERGRTLRRARPTERVARDGFSGSDGGRLRAVPRLSVPRRRTGEEPRSSSCAREATWPPPWRPARRDCLFPRPAAAPRFCARHRRAALLSPPAAPRAPASRLASWRRGVPAEQRLSPADAPASLAVRSLVDRLAATGPGADGPRAGHAPIPARDARTAPRRPSRRALTGAPPWHPRKSSSTRVVT